MTILAIDSSNFPLGIALVNNNKVIGERITYVKKNHSIRLMPAITNLMEECDVNPKDLSKIVVAKGPGSYTGVRIGVTVAKTLAWTLNKPLVGISSLEVMAASVGRYFDGLVCPIIDARRGHVYTALYEYKNNELQTIEEDNYTSLESLLNKLEEVPKGILFVGNDLSIHEEAIINKNKSNFIKAYHTENNPRPSELAFLSNNKEADNIHSFTPNYIRLAEAEANWIANNKSKTGTNED